MESMFEVLELLRKEYLELEKEGDAAQVEILALEQKISRIAQARISVKHFLDAFMIVQDLPTKYDILKESIKNAKRNV